MEARKIEFIKDKNGNRFIDTKGYTSLMDINEAEVCPNTMRFKEGIGYADGDSFNYVGVHDFCHNQRNIYIMNEKLPDSINTGNSMVLQQSKCDDEFIHTNMYRIVVYKKGMGNKVIRRFSGCRFII